MRSSDDPALPGLIEALRSNPIDFASDPLVGRAQFEAMLATIPAPEEFAFIADSLAGVAAIRIETPASAADHAMLYLHGGAYVAGSAQGYRVLAGELARSSGATGFAIDYALAPEARFPGAVDDAVSAYRALLDRGFAPRRIMVAGDSAGGGLALALLVRLRDEGVPMPAAALLISPWADLRCDSPSYAANAAADPSLTQAGLAAAAAIYLGGADPAHPHASPGLADLTGLPPLLIHVGSIEILRDDAVAIAARAGAGGVAVRLEIWPGMPHVWHGFGFMLGAGRDAVAAAGAFLAQAAR